MTHALMVMDMAVYLMPTPRAISVAHRGKAQSDRGRHLLSRFGVGNACARRSGATAGSMVQTMAKTRASTPLAHAGR
ncbi:hypothetical protein C4901_15170 [Acidiferrobacter sp. SPIII_3]|nr:hypothetical protein C4901_15170 [Acidiferrobacter sp. SPIII_3]